MNRFKSMDKRQLLVLTGFMLCMVILIWRCFYSVNYADEPYCISSVWRFHKGDALLAEDWFPAQQLISWILAPLYWLFRLFSDTNDGIMLASRLAYVAFQGIVSVFAYCRLKKYEYFRIPAVMIYLLSTQNNMLTLNYNTLGIGCVFLILTILTTEEKYMAGTLMGVGVLVAVMVLSQPYAILMFLLWGAVVLAAVPFGKKRKLHPLMKFRTYFFVGLGAFFVLIAFVLVILARAGIDEVLNGFQYLMSDPEHQMDLHYKVTKYFERFYRYYQYQILMTGVCLVVGFLKKHKITQYMKIMSFLLAIGAAIHTLILHGWLSDYVPIDFICVPMMFLGISIWALGKKKNPELFWGWMIPAIIYTFCVQLTTNTGILAVSSACIVASAGGILMIGESLSDSKDKLSKAVMQAVLFLVVAVIILQGALLMYHRVVYTWWSSPVEECTEKLERGPAKGIYTSPEDAQWYYDTLDAVDSLLIAKDKPILFLDLAPWLYLYTDSPVGAYSMWTIGEDNFLEKYYECYPEKEPEMVCWMGAGTLEEAVCSSYFVEKGYEVIEINGGIALRNNI